MKVLLTLAILAVCGFVINAVALALIGPVWSIDIPAEIVGWMGFFGALVVGIAVWSVVSYSRGHGAWWMLLGGVLGALLFGLALFGAMRTHNTVPTPCYDCPPAPW